jgi:hypothetical protein
MTAHALLPSKSAPPCSNIFKFMHCCNSSKTLVLQKWPSIATPSKEIKLLKGLVSGLCSVYRQTLDLRLPWRTHPAHSPCPRHCIHVQYQHQLLSSYHPDRCMLLLQCFGCHSIVARPSCHVPEFASDGMDIRDVQKLLIVSTTSFTIACIQSTRHWQRSRHILAHRPKIPQSIISNAKTCNKMNVQFQVTVSCKPAAPLTL